MWTSLNKKIYLFISVIFAIGIVGGTLFLIYLDESSKELLLLNINEWLQGLDSSNINNIFSHLLIISSLCVLSLFIVGIPLVLFFIFYSGFSIGFMLSSLVNIFGIKGLIYGIVYIVITKGIFLFFFLILALSLIKLSIILLKRLIKPSSDKENLGILFKRIILCIAIILLSDILIYFGGAKLITLFNFLLN